MNLQSTPLIFQRFFDYYKEELHLNRELNRYSIDTHEEYMGVNTVQGQLGFASERGKEIFSNDIMAFVWSLRGPHFHCSNPENYR